MKIKAVLFDLDATLLPMNQDLFIGTYLKGLADYMEPFGYEAESFTKSMWIAVKAMLKNDGNVTNEEKFWAVFSDSIGIDARKDEGIFEEFYKTRFQEYKEICGYTPDERKRIIDIAMEDFKRVFSDYPKT
ncbi:MAG: hypothetical protein J6V50_02840, partial [Clostridia bacterium]|nr:hypothetical protein [Clostridia bacterium]